MSSTNRWFVLTIVSSALLLIVVDMTVLYTALPQLTQDLQASASEKLWIVNAYALVMAGLLPLTGTLTDKFGPRPVFIFGMVVFGLASVLAAFAPSAAALIGYRVLLAIGASMMMPATLAIVRLVFVDPDERSLAIGIWSAIAAGGAAFGPVLGGLLLHSFWWGSVFLINVPVIAVGLIAAIKMVPRTAGHASIKIDFPSAGLILIGLASLVYAIKEVSQSANLLSIGGVAAIVSAVFLTLFARRQRHQSTPMIDFTLFSNPVFTAGVVAAIVSAAALMGLQFALSQRFQLVQGLSPLQAGLAILPIPAAALISGPVAGLLLPKIGAYRLLWLSLLAAGLGVGGYLLAEGGNPMIQIAALALFGTSLGSTITAASSSILMNAPEHGAGSAASVEEVSYELGGAIGVAVLGGIMVGTYSSTFTPPPGLSADTVARDSFDGAIHHAETLDADLAQAVMAAAQTAFESSFLMVGGLCCALLLVTATILAISSRKHKSIRA